MTSRTRAWLLVVLLALAALLPSLAAHAGPDDHVYAFGDAAFHGSTGATPLPAPIVDMAAHPSGNGYWLVTGKGRVHPFGSVAFFGDTGFFTLNSPIVAMASTPSGNGYWLSAEDGGIFSFGNASFFGSAFGASPAPFVDLKPTPSGNGYWQVAADGSVHARGGAVDHGDLTGLPLAHPIVAMAVTPSGNGYWLLADDGGVFTFGDAVFLGSPAVTGIDAVDIAARPAGGGYWIAGADGTVTNHGLAPALGSAAPSRPITAIAAHPGSNGYWLADEGNGPPPPGAIEGTVTDDTGAPAPGVCVSAYMAFGPGSFDQGFGTTDTSGHYRIDGLDAGTYNVWFSDCDGQDYIGAAYPGSVVVTSGATTSGVDMVLQRAGGVTGVVTGPGGSPAEGVCVNVMTEDRTRGASGFTSSTGYYRAGGLPGGDYHVEFVACSEAAGNLASEWWDDQPTEATADTLHVEAGTTVTGIDAQLAAGAEVNGVVTDESAVPLANICVSAYHQSGDVANGGFTSSTGYYRVTGLPAGTYQVRFSDCYIWDGGSYAPEWWDDKPTRDTADPIPLAEGQVHTGVDAALGLAGQVSGVVSDESGAPIQHMCVRAYDADGIESAYAQTSSTGFYRLDGLGTTSYAVRADDCLLGRYGYSWYDGKGTRATADPVAVVGGSETPGIDFTLLPPGTVAGTVTDADGNQLDRVCVDVYDPSGVQVWGTQTSSTGYYSVGALHAQDYRLHFEDCGGRGLPEEWYDDQPDLASATPVPVSAGATSTADVVLGELPATAPGSPTGVTAKAGKASATVSWTAPASDGGSPITGYRVTASPGGQTATVSGADTSATVTGLTNGTTYTFTVVAINAVGESPPSSPSNPVTPKGPKPRR